MIGQIFRQLGTDISQADDCSIHDNQVSCLRFTKARTGCRMGLPPGVLSTQMLGGLGRSARQLRRMGCDRCGVHRLTCDHFGWAYSSTCLPAIYRSNVAMKVDRIELEVGCELRRLFSVAASHRVDSDDSGLLVPFRHRIGSEECPDDREIRTVGVVLVSLYHALRLVLEGRHLRIGGVGKDTARASVFAGNRGVGEGKTRADGQEAAMPISYEWLVLA